MFAPIAILFPFGLYKLLLSVPIEMLQLSVLLYPIMFTPYELVSVLLLLPTNSLVFDFKTLATIFPD